MYVRLKTNRSGSTTVVVVEKKAGRQVYVKSIGTSSNPAEIAFFTEQGEHYIEEENKKKYPELDFDGARERAAEAELKATEEFLSRIENVIHDAPKRILDRVFDAVGFHAVGGDKITVAVDEDMVAADAKWDGLKGYISNATLTPSAIVEAYHQLYNVEQSFRISKSKLEIRPIFHFNHNRIKAHISICFVALKVYRELDRLLKKNKMGLSVDAVLNVAKSIPTISVKMAESTLTKTLFLTKRQEQIKPLFEEKFWVTQNYSESQ